MRTMFFFFLVDGFGHLERFICPGVSDHADKTPCLFAPGGRSERLTPFRMIIELLCPFVERGAHGHDYYSFIFWESAGRPG